MYSWAKITYKEVTGLEKSMCMSLEEYYRTRNLGEFKKAQFAKLLKENLKYETDISSDIKELINEII